MDAVVPDVWPSPTMNPDFYSRHWTFQIYHMRSHMQVISCNQNQLFDLISSVMFVFRNTADRVGHKYRNSKYSRLSLSRIYQDRTAHRSNGRCMGQNQSFSFKRNKKDKLNQIKDPVTQAKVQKTERETKQRKKKQITRNLQEILE